MLPGLWKFQAEARTTTMPGKAAKVTITERQQEILDEFSRSRSEPLFLSQRSTIILLAFAGLLNEEIAPQVDLERHQVGIWRARWALPLISSCSSSAWKAAPL